MLTLVARPDIVIDPFGVFFPVKVSRDQFKGFFLFKVPGFP